MNKIKLMEILARLPLFAGLNPAERQVLMKMTTNIKRIRADTVFIKEGAHEPFFYIILAGRAAVRYRRKSIGSLVPGQFIGEVGFICQEPRRATVVAESDMVVMLIDAEDFRRLPARVREAIKDNIITGLVERVCSMNSNAIRYEETIDELHDMMQTFQETMERSQRASVFEHK